MRVDMAAVIGTHGTVHVSCLVPDGSRVVSRLVRINFLWVKIDFLVKPSTRLHEKRIFSNSGNLDSRLLAPPHNAKCETELDITIAC